MLNYTRRTIFLKTTNRFKDASRWGRNVAPNAIFYFLKPTNLTSAFEAALPVLLEPMCLDSQSPKTPDSFLSLRRTSLPTQDRLATRLVELLDDGVALVTTGFNDLLSPSALMQFSHSARAIRLFANPLTQPTSRNTGAGTSLTDLVNFNT